MKLLITSGGTKIPIDRVRHIANMSKGTFGARIAESAMESCGEDLEVIFLAAKGSKLPQMGGHPHNLSVIFYDTFWDYAGKLETICKIDKPDGIILAAAVSDYEVENMVDGKIRTGDDLCIRLKPLPKLISQIREWTEFRPNTVVCGFKLLVDSTDLELVQAGLSSFYKNDLDFVVCNDLRDIKGDNHRLHMIRKSLTAGFSVTLHSQRENPGEDHFLSRIVAGTVLDRMEAHEEDSLLPAKGPRHRYVHDEDDL